MSGTLQTGQYISFFGAQIIELFRRAYAWCTHSGCHATHRLHIAIADAREDTPWRGAPWVSSRAKLGICGVREARGTRSRGWSRNERSSRRMSEYLTDEPEDGDTIILAHDA